MSLSRLRLITFDVTDTLLKFRSAPGAQYGEVGAMYGVLGDNDSLSKNFKKHWRQMNQTHPNFGLETGIGWEEWWKSIIKGTFLDSNFQLDDQKLNSIATHLIEVYKTSACWQQCYGVPGLLSYIKSKGIPMGIISNFDPRLSTTLSNTKLRHYFSFVLTSYEVGVQKPEPGIFQEALKASNIKGIRPDECLHVGDSPALDYIGARKSGWNSYLVGDRDIQELLKKHPEVDPQHLFSSCYQLHKYFIHAIGDDLEKYTLKLGF